jgi:hypothetical protein
MYQEQIGPDLLRWHGGKVIGDTPLRLLGLMIVDKDQPITTMVK